MRVPYSRQGGWAWPHVSERPQSGRCCIFGWVKSNPVTWTWAQGAALRGDPRTLRRESWEARQGRRKDAKKDGVDQHDPLWARGPQSTGPNTPQNTLSCPTRRCPGSWGVYLPPPAHPSPPTPRHSIFWWPKAALGAGALTVPAHQPVENLLAARREVKKDERTELPCLGFASQGGLRRWQDPEVSPFL